MVKSIKRIRLDAPTTGKTVKAHKEAMAARHGGGISRYRALLERDAKYPTSDPYAVPAERLTKYMAIRTLVGSDFLTAKERDFLKDILGWRSPLSTAQKEWVVWLHGHVDSGTYINDEAYLDILYDD